jgi:hypothetical protein
LAFDVVRNRDLRPDGLETSRHGARQTDVLLDAAIYIPRKQAVGRVYGSQHQVIRGSSIISCAPTGRRRLRFHWSTHPRSAARHTNRLQGSAWLRAFAQLNASHLRRGHSFYDMTRVQLAIIALHTPVRSVWHHCANWSSELHDQSFCHAFGNYQHAGSSHSSNLACIVDPRGGMIVIT